MGIDELISASNMGVRQGKVVKHRNNRLNLIVNDNNMIALAVKGLNSAAFGYVKIEAFRTMKEALTYARQQIP
jgi:hypothetical protein